MSTSPQFQTKLTHGHPLSYAVFYSHNLTVLCRAFTTFVRPILQYASHIWNPVTLKSVNDLEHAQRHFTTSRIPALKHLSYSERLALLSLDWFEIRRLRSDLILYYKMFNNFVCINSGDHFSDFTPSSVNTRSSEARLVFSFGRTRTLSNNFFFRHIN